ncbi:MAG: class E sortase [Candidatus Peregrinibacteria bacterium]
MHISYESENIGFNSNSSWGDKFWQFVRFTVVTGMIFIVSFFAINFSAYKQILLDTFNPAARAEAEAVLSTSTGQGNADATKLLPVLPDKKQVRKEFAWVDAPISPTDNRLVIPKLGKSIPLVTMSTENLEGENWNDLEKQIQSGLRDGVVHYPGTAKPGQVGNFFVTGHSSYYPWDPGQFKDVFALLGRLEPGDLFYAFYDQRRYTYKVYDKFEVQPNVVNVLEQPTDKRMATLMTCTPVGTTLRRLILHAEEV